MSYVIRSSCLRAFVQIRLFVPPVFALSPACSSLLNSLVPLSTCLFCVSISHLCNLSHSLLSLSLSVFSAALLKAEQERLAEEARIAQEAAEKEAKKKGKKPPAKQSVTSPKASKDKHFDKEKEAEGTEWHNSRLIDRMTC